MVSGDLAVWPMVFAIYVHARAREQDSMRIRADFAHLLGSRLVAASHKVVAQHRRIVGRQAQRGQRMIDGPDGATLALQSLPAKHAAAAAAP